MNIDKVVLDPSSVFTCPEDVFADKSLNKDQKIKILRVWEYDARELEVAEEENMGGGPPNMLDEVLKVLNRLDAEIDSEHSPPTKQGGE